MQQESQNKLIWDETSIIQILNAVSLTSSRNLSISKEAEDGEMEEADALNAWSSYLICVRNHQRLATDQLTAS